MHPAKPDDRSGLGRAIDAVEETTIALLLGVMTLVTFANVVTRYIFNSNILWALETTSFLFAWLVLLGASYCVKTRAHLGVDVVTALLPPGARRAVGLFASAVCIGFALLLLKGAWDFYAPYANLSPTSGRWFPSGFEEVRGRGWYEVTDIPMPGWLNAVMADAFNEGERYEKLPLLIPYVALPVSMLLLTWRFVQAAVDIARGTRDGLVASHEVEEELQALEAERGREA